MDSETKILICMPIFIILFIWGITFGSYKYKVEVLSANIVEAYMGDKKIYEGKQAFLSVDSGGMTTHLTIYKKLYPPVVDRTYSSNDIKIVPKGDK